MRRFQNVHIPYGAYWSTPFARWQGSFAHLHAVQFGAHVTRQELARRGIAATAFDGALLGLTTPQRSSFHGLPWFMNMIGAPEVGGPQVAQACATGTRLLQLAAQEVELGSAEAMLAVCCDKTSNGPMVLYPDAGSAGGGRPETEHWVLDNFNGVTAGVDFADEPIVATAENCVREWQISRAEMDDVTAHRYAQYKDATADDHAFQKRYMTLPFEVPDAKFKRVKTTLAGDEGVHDTTRDKLAALKPAQPGGTLTFGNQTHPADGSAAVIVTGKARAAEFSRDPSIEITLRGFGTARSKLKFMPAAPVPAAKKALEQAGIGIGQVDAVKSHNPFVVNDIVFARETGFDVMKMNNYGSSLVFGHPHGPTPMRSTIELIEELVLRGGGVGLFEGCAAGDTGMALVVEVTDRRR
ncbi:thiolase family protein [Desertibaculum subflavum]|uniref:thiolase family protein n=1 Tax=Desertibaculum subflavum TaxID=2268458 RepID=UPI000E673FE5